MFEEAPQDAAHAGSAGASSFVGDPARPTHPVLAAPLAAQACLAQGLSSPGWSLSLSELQAALVDVETTTNILEAYRLHLIPMLLTREVGARSPGAPTVAWMSDHLRISRGQARADLDAARAAAPDTGTLPLMGAALAEGAIRREHLDIAVRALSELPTGFVRARSSDIDALLTDHARRYAPTDAKRLAAHLIATLAPDGVEEYDDEAYERRGLDVRTDSTGVVRLEGTLDPVGGAVVKTVLDHLADPERSPRGAGGNAAGGSDGADGQAPGAEGEDSGQVGAPAPVPEQRSPRQRQADALIEMARLAQAALGQDSPLAEPARIVVHTTPEQLGHPDPLDPDAHCRPATDHPTSEDEDEGSREADSDGADHQTDQAPSARDKTGVAREGDGAEETDSADDNARQAPETTAGTGTRAADPGPDDGHPLASCLAPGAAHCEGLGAISPRTLHTLACDAVIERVVIDRHGAVLSLESLGRLANRAQRRALAARDGGCTWPGCSAPPTWCDAHHIIWWSRGGPTIIDNLCLLCQHHHTQIHREEWQITVRHGVPWFIPPPWIDPAQEPRRNSLHADITHTRRIGQRLLTGQPLDDLAPPRPGHGGDLAA